MADKVLKAAFKIGLPTVSFVAHTNLNVLHNKVSCESSAFAGVSHEQKGSKSEYQPSTEGGDKRNKLRSPTKLQTQMTSIGRFSLQSETILNPSIPTFFVTLVKKGKSQTGDDSDNLLLPKKGMNASDIQRLFVDRDIFTKHPRFQSRVSLHSDSHFEPSSLDLNTYIKDVLHFSSYRSELEHRIATFLTEPIDTCNKLWEAHVSSGPIGSSGALSKSVVMNHNPNDTETVVLFRSHHVLADGMSLGFALSDLSDEGAAIRDMVINELKRRGKAKSRQSFLRKFLGLFRFFYYWVWGGMKAFSYHSYLLMMSPQNPFTLIMVKNKKDNVSSSDDVNMTVDRSVSWCQAAKVSDVKYIASKVCPTATINDVFVSCASYAIGKQLEQHQNTSSGGISNDDKSKDRKIALPSHVNVVMPVHLYGGVILPGQSMGNRIGAMVARVPSSPVHKPNEHNISSTASERLSEVSRNISFVKKSPIAHLSWITAKFCSDYLPAPLVKYLMRNANANAAFVLSNVRGNTKKVHWNGHTVENAIGFLPLPPGIPVGIVVQSYAGQLSISISADKKAVPDADLFLKWMLDEYFRLSVEAAALSTSDAKCL